MQPTTPIQSTTVSTAMPGRTDTGDTIETFVWVEEHDWLYALLQSGLNVSPKFRVPDLISACVSQLLAQEDASDRLFGYLGAELIMRAPGTPRRKESMWRDQYQQLQALQRSPSNRYPNPQFQLDQLTTACVALACREDRSGATTLRHARINIVRRSAIGKVILSA
ncbi:hypothetical protein [Sphaerotilus sp.]|uniref:hypothetical protein n=1 Tax=Sphaerotilus sp. TaxID=2093942 RepID=UPI002ACE1134|nr:hypothetical protein [Sphaerotilus sp.]MDZ7855928.1 hypothetical protein [Sphaerotilus sp.]